MKQIRETVIDATKLWFVSGFNAVMAAALLCLLATPISATFNLLVDGSFDGVVIDTTQMERQHSNGGWF